MPGPELETPASPPRAHRPSKHSKKHKQHGSKASEPGAVHASSPKKHKKKHAHGTVPISPEKAALYDNPDAREPEPFVIPGASSSSAKPLSSKNSKRKKRSHKKKATESETVVQRNRAVADQGPSAYSAPPAVPFAFDATESEHRSTEISYGNQDFSGSPLEAHIVDRSEIRADVEAELRDIIGPVIPAESMQNKSLPEEHQPPLKDYKWLTLACIGLLVIVIVVVGVVFGLKDPEPSITQVFTPASLKCDTANTLIAPNVSSIAVRGSTVNATESAPCGEENFAVWYSIMGTGNAFKLTSCSDYTDFPTQLVVSRRCSDFAHSCWPSMKDTDCKSNQNAARLDWQTEEGVKYDIAIGGRTSDSHGNYELILTETSGEVVADPPMPDPTDQPTTLEPTTPEPSTPEPTMPEPSIPFSGTVASMSCNAANMLDPPRGAAVIVAGNTFDATNSAQCGETNLAVFYKVIGTGNIFEASTCADSTDFATQLSITKDCSRSAYCYQSLQDLNCSNPNSARRRWLTDPNQVYGIAVGGQTENSQGNFQMTLTEKVLPPGAFCKEPTQMAAPQGSSVTVVGTTVNAWWNDKANCAETNKAVWFSAVGTGNVFKLTTCSEKTTFPTQVSVTEDCSRSSFTCMNALSDLDCPGNAAAIEWVTKAGVVYQISVGGRTREAEGSFELTLTEKVLPDGAYCASPVALPAPQGSTVSVTGNTTNAIKKSSCGESNTAVFYSVTGTANTFTVTTCSAVTDFPTQISVTEDCSTSSFTCWSELQDLECPTNTFAASTSWVSEAGVTYQIAVGGRSTESQGNFELILTEDTTVQV